MNYQLSKTVKTLRVSNAVSAGTTAVNSDTVDTLGFGGVMFTVAFGTLTTDAAPVVTLKHGDASDMSDEATVSGATHTLAHTDDNKLVVIDLNNVKKRYVRINIARSGANAVVDSIVCDLYKATKLPTTTHSTVDAVVAVYTGESA
jgi:hypothetical protein